MRRGKLTLVAVLLVCLVSVGHGGNPYSLGRPYEVILRSVLAVSNPGAAAHDLQVKMPVIPVDSLPVYLAINGIAKDLGSEQLVPAGQGRSVLTLGTVPARQSRRYIIEYRLSTYPVKFKLPWFPRRSWPELPAEAKSYLGAVSGIEADHAEIVAFAKEHAGRWADPIFQAKSLYAAVNRLLTYDIAAGKTSALLTLRRQRASCEGYARLYAALCRAMGIPARLIYGLRLQGTELVEHEVSVDRAHHVWVEVYLAGLGWAPVDPTFTYTVDGKKKVTYSYFTAISRNDIHLFLGYNEQNVTWTYLVPPGHPGVEVEHHLYLRRLE